MNGLPLSSNASYHYYFPLLLRYARRMVKEEEAAAAMAREVLEEAFASNGLAPHPGLRRLLQVALNYRCHYWIQARIFDRPVEKLPFTDTQNPTTQKK